MAKRNGTSQVMVYKIPFRKVITRTSLKHGDDRCSGRIGRSCSTGGPGHVILAKHSVIIHEWGQDGIVNTIQRTYPW